MNWGGFNPQPPTIPSLRVLPWRAVKRPDVFGTSHNTLAGVIRARCVWSRDVRRRCPRDRSTYIALCNGAAGIDQPIWRQIVLLTVKQRTKMPARLHGVKWLRSSAVV